jgi:hypothetical protein
MGTRAPSPALSAKRQEELRGVTLSRNGSAAAPCGRERLRSQQELAGRLQLTWASGPDAV